jgi:hypothetical protein
MSFVIPMDNTVVKEGGSSAPIVGKFLATILSTKKDSFGIVKRPFAKQGPNAGITALAIRLRIDDGQVGAGKNVFTDIPLARKFAGTGQGKYPDGSPAYGFFQFFRALGYDVDQPQGFTLPEDNALINQKVEVVLELEYDNEGKPRERVRFINQVSVTTSANTETREQIDAKVTAWIAAHPLQGQQAPVTGQAAPAWAPGAAAPAAPTGWAPQAPPAPTGWAPAPPAPVAASWTPDPADVAYANQQAGVAPTFPQAQPGI